MADSSVGIKTGVDAQVSTRTNASGEHMEVVMLGIDGSNSVVTADATNGIDVDVTRVSGTVAVSPAGNATATLANVTAATSSTTLFASNANRKGAILHNDSTSILYLKYGTAASTTSYTYKIVADATWEMPSFIYTGAITGIWVAANGAARTTEIT